MIQQIQKLDRVTLVAPLGLRFCDFTSGTFVGDGLDVQVYPPGSPARKVPAVANRSGVYVLHHAPGLRELEYGEGDQAYWNELPPARDFVIEVNDNERRFQPFQFIAGLPARGFYKWVDPLLSSPPTPAASIPLYSSPVRAVPPGMAVLRADLWDGSNDIAASWAVIEASLNDRIIARGIADEQGRIALMFPYPAPRSFSVTSPPGSPLGSPPRAKTLALTEQVWSIGLRAFYTSARPIASPPNAFAANPVLPELRFTLSQPEATIWADATLSEPLLEASLHYGHELVLQSRAATSPPSQSRQSVLFITPAVSPP
ncbi:MAG: hypothetical protein QOF62_2412 [Pyrinomonadaceae bacterium]|jgi:hypothetical protein|nr:hypothetical protein [Pyrinomonadaceae bacterium]